MQLVELDGLRVIVDPLAHVDSVALSVWVAVGARHDSALHTGMAHLLEHMVFKGTERRSARRIVEDIEAVGGQFNAFTAREFTAYDMRLLARDWGLGLEVLADVLLRSRFDAAALEQEKRVVVQEIAQARDVPEDYVFDLFQGCAFPDQPLGRPILGYTDTLAAILPQDIRAHVGRHYGRESLVVAISGKVDPQEFCARVAELFADCGALPAASGGAQGAACYGGGTVRVAARQAQQQIVVGFPCQGWLETRDDSALLVCNELLGGGMTSRLFQRIREELGLVYSIYSFVDMYRDARVLGIHAGTGDAAAMLPAVAEVMKGIAAGGVSEAEAARARAQVLAAMVLGMESPVARVEFAARHVLRHGVLPDLAVISARIAAVSATDLALMAAALLAAPGTLAAYGNIDGVAPESLALFAA